MTIQQLFTKYLDETITPEEFSRLYEMMKAGYQDDELDELLENAFSNPRFVVGAGDHDRAEVFASLLAKMGEAAMGSHEVAIGSREVVQTPPSSAPVVRIGWRKWMAAGAAAIIILLAGSIYLYRKARVTNEPLATAKRPVHFDAPPGRNGAILTLSNGQQLLLDSVQNGLLEQEGNTRMHKADGQLSYEAREPEAAISQASYNTITTPRGRQFNLVLSDGTHVLLNAASSIRYPTSFTGSERRVLVSGEAYFEVARNRDHPFIVQLSRGEVRVLGTHFDVADYNDENNVNTTLVEGSIKLQTAGEEISLKPGQQGRIDRSSGKLFSLPTDTSAAIAWTRGRLDIGNADLAFLMRQISRWYDVDVVFQGKIPNVHIGGIIHRDVNLATVLGYLEDNGVHYTIKEKTILISP